MSAPSNFLVAASAGTGKTFALSSHVLRLLLLGEAPEAVLALTFSRLAAAEIFDRVVGRLAAATESDAEAAKLSGELAEGDGGAPLRARFPDGVPRAEFLRVLRAFLAAQHRSRLGTIDSFMARINIIMYLLIAEIFLMIHILINDLLLLLNPLNLFLHNIQLQ